MAAYGLWSLPWPPVHSWEGILGAGLFSAAAAAGEASGAQWLYFSWRVGRIEKRRLTHSHVRSTHNGVATSDGYFAAGDTNLYTGPLRTNWRDAANRPVDSQSDDVVAGSRDLRTRNSTGRRSTVHRTGWPVSRSQYKRAFCLAISRMEWLIVVRVHPLACFSLQLQTSRPCPPRMHRTAPSERR